jgi:hypothetical protein
MAVPEIWERGNEILPVGGRQAKIDKIVADELLMAKLMGFSTNSLDLEKVIAYEVTLVNGQPAHQGSFLSAKEAPRTDMLPDNVVPLRPLNSHDTAA